MPCATKALWAAFCGLAKKKGPAFPPAKLDALQAVAESVPSISVRQTTRPKTIEKE
jgi:hypothetical protein